MIIKKTGADWSFPESEDLPSLRIRGILITPLARVLKVVEQREKLGQWYRMVNKAIPLLEIKRSKRSGSIDELLRDLN